MQQLPPLPQSWSALTWQQLCDVWTAKMRYGGNADVAQAAALLALTGLTPVAEPCPTEATGAAGGSLDAQTGERLYLLADKDGRQYTATPRLLAHIARQALPWLQYPYGDQGDREERDDDGKVVRERREGHRGYVNTATDWRDAMALPQETVTIEVQGSCVPLVASDQRSSARFKVQGSSSGNRESLTINHEPVETFVFALPQVAMNNLTWHQYRALQAIVPLIFQEGTSDDDALSMQAQFLAYSMTPEAATGSDADPFAPRHRFKYDADRAEQTVAFWREQLAQGSPLFHICFQVYQTAMQNYYPSVYPLLFGGSSSKSDPLHTALSGEVDTINAVMKYQGYTDPQQVYDANLPIVFGTLNTMTKEAKEIEKMNQKIKRKH